MKCWICGGFARTGEHLIKASDIKGHFGSISQRHRLFLSTRKHEKKPIATIRSPYLKSRSLLCEFCNTTLSQPYDRAWEKLSAYLRVENRGLRVGERIFLDKIYPEDTRQGLLFLQLYFVKLFGCRIAESGVPISLGQFAFSLLNKKEHPNIYLVVGRVHKSATRKHAGLSEIQASLDDGERCHFAAWFYMIDHVAVEVIYRVGGAPLHFQGSIIHSGRTRRVVRLADFGLRIV